ncbi:MAG: helix-turn-helix domain-containing protein, partial [Lentisphaeria bacterium]|nr:helix-turn-helix domain-containing protein [Lentisphaeria bacterium]
KNIMRYNKFFTDKFFHGNEQVAVFLREDSPQVFPQPYSTLNQREFWKITSILSGQGVLVINGRRYPVFPGFVSLIHPQDLTAWELTEPLTLYNVLFQRSAVENEIQQWGKKNDFFAIFQAEKQSELSVRHELLHLLDANRNITSLIKKMHQEYKRDDLHSEDLLRIYLLELLLELSRSSLKGFARNRKTIILNFIREKLMSPGAVMPDIPALCAESGFSYGYLLSAYKNTFHETMGQTLLKNRISYAVELLKNSSYPVSQICMMCGFSDISNFYRFFRRETGHSPSFYRRK